jgi:uncharacterized protein (TIGR02231 family)
MKSITTTMTALLWSSLSSLSMLTVASVLTLSSALAAPAPRADRVERVVVFSDRAEVTRSAVARCEGGVAAVVFAPLPDSIDPRTLRGEASGDATPVGVASNIEEQKESLDERVRELQAQVQQLDIEIANLGRAQADDDERLRSVQSYGPWFRTAVQEDLRQEKPAIDRFEQLLQTLSTETMTASSARVARTAQNRTLQRRRGRLAQRLANLSAAETDVAAVLSATVSVRCGTTTSPTVRLSYLVPAAQWNPEYDLRFAGPAGAKVGAGTAVLTVAGVIRQSSGEDWDDAEVWLSTAKPRLGGEAPLPLPIYVDGAPEDTQKTLVQAQENRPADLKAGGGGGSSVAGAELDDGGKAFVLKLPRKVTVRADGRPYWFPVDDLSSKATSSLVAVPALSPWVFQVARLNSPAAFPLVEGTMHVFRAGTLVGDVQLPYRAPGEPMEVSLGIDEEIALERVDLTKGRREAGFFSGSQSIVQANRTILRNRSGGDVVVELREQIPVSKNADIKVTVDTQKTSTGFGTDPVRGHLTWKVGLKKGESGQRDLHFTIALPKEWAVQ